MARGDLRLIYALGQVHLHFFFSYLVILANYLRKINTRLSKTHIIVMLSFAFAVFLSRPHPSSVK